MITTATIGADLIHAALGFCAGWLMGAWWCHPHPDNHGRGRRE